MQGRPFLIIFWVVGTTLASHPWEPERKTQSKWLKAHNDFKENTLRNGTSINVLFYGDSLIQGWNRAGESSFEKYFGPLHATSYGIGGDRTQQVLWRLQHGEVDGLQPKVVVLHAGATNLGEADDDDSGIKDIARGILAIVEELQRKLPKSYVLLLGLLPARDADWTEAASKVNSILATKVNGKSVRFLDMSAHFYREGNERDGGDFVRGMYNNDKVHLTAEGYAKWAEVMSPLLKQMMVENPAAGNFGAGNHKKSQYAWGFGLISWLLIRYVM